MVKVTKMIYFVWRISPTCIEEYLKYAQESFTTLKRIAQRMIQVLRSNVKVTLIDQRSKTSKSIDVHMFIIARWSVAI
jgi:hypothetical protein